LRVDVLIRDPSRACRTTLHSALRDAAISGFQFCHVTLRFVPEPQPTLEQIMQSMQEEKPLGGAGPRRRISGLMLSPKIDLANAPKWARHRD